MNVLSLKRASVFPSVLNDDVVIALDALQNCEVLFCTKRVFEVYQSRMVLLRKLVANFDSTSDQSVLPMLLTCSASCYVGVLRLRIRKYWVVRTWNRFIFRDFCPNICLGIFFDWVWKTPQIHPFSGLVRVALFTAWGAHAARSGTSRAKHSCFATFKTPKFIFSKVRVYLAYYRAKARESNLGSHAATPFCHSRFPCRSLYLVVATQVTSLLCSGRFLRSSVAKKMARAKEHRAIILSETHLMCLSFAHIRKLFPFLVPLLTGKVPLSALCPVLFIILANEHSVLRKCIPWVVLDHSDAPGGHHECNTKTWSIDAPSCALDFGQQMLELILKSLKLQQMRGQIWNVSKTVRNIVTARNCLYPLNTSFRSKSSSDVINQDQSHSEQQYFLLP